MWVVTAWRETTLFPSSWMTCEYILNSFGSKEALAEDLGASKCPGKTELCQSLGGWSWVKLWSAFLCWRAEALLRTKTQNWNWGLKHENEPARQRARRNGLWTEYSKYSIPEREETWHLQGKKKKKWPWGQGTRFQTEWHGVGWTHPKITRDQLRGARQATRDFTLSTMRWHPGLVSDGAD